MPDPNVVIVDPSSSVAGRAPGLPPLDLPQGEAPPPRKPLRVEMAPKTQAERRQLQENQRQASAKWSDTAPEWQPPAQQAAPAGPKWSDTVSEWKPTDQEKPEVSKGQAVGEGIGAGISFGAGPAGEGIAAASGIPQPQSIAGRATGEAALRPLKGAWDFIQEKISGTEGPATEAYNKAREKAEKRLEAAREQHPGYVLGGEVAGSLAAPVPLGGTLAEGASLGTRLGRGAVAGAAGGGLYGAGSAVSRGEDLPGIATEAASSAALGAPLGAAVHGAIGPRVPVNPNSPGQRAAQTAIDLGAPLPRGVTSDSAKTQSLTSSLRQVPFVGKKIGERVGKTEEAAGQRIEDIAAGNAIVPPDRAVAGAALRPAVSDLIEKNKTEIDNSYNYLRTLFENHKYAEVKNTRAAVGHRDPSRELGQGSIMQRRRGARMANPESGLGDILNMVEAGVSFDGLQRMRNHIAQQIEFAKTHPHPGMDMADLRRIYAAMTADMEASVRKYAYGGQIGANRASAALANANQTAQKFIDQNGMLQRVLNFTEDERLAGKLLGAAQAKTGNHRLLAQLKAGLDPDDFHQVSGALLAELGRSNARNGEFSLNQFVTQWDKISPQAKQILFSPQHLQDIEDIVHMGSHIKGALKESTSSHSASALVTMEVLSQVAGAVIDFAHGGMGWGTALDVANAGTMFLVTNWLASPAKARSVARWAAARQALEQGRTAGRIAAFNIASRNMANTLGIPLESIVQHTRGVTGSSSGPPSLPPPPSPQKLQGRVPFSVQ